MPLISQMKQSNFLKKEDVGSGALATISKVSEENVAMAGAPEELKWCIHFVEFEKPMVLNVVNMTVIASITGSEDTDDWIGKRIVLFNDPNVSYGGKVIGGIRCRAPRGQAARQAPQPPVRTAPPAAPAAPEALDENEPY